MNSFFSTFLTIMIALIHQASIGLTQKLTISMSKYALGGGSVTIKCNAHTHVGKSAVMHLQYRMNSKNTQDIIVVTKNASSMTTTLRAFKNRIEDIYIHKIWPNVNMTLTQLTCNDSRVYVCWFYNDKGNVYKNDTKLNVLENEGNITMNIKEPANYCLGTYTQCSVCFKLNNIQGYAELGKSFTIDCTKKMAFPSEPAGVNTFKWYFVQSTGNGSFRESEIKTGITGTSPQFSKGYPNVTSSKHIENNCQKLEYKTSSMTYTPTKDNRQVITFKCRTELKIESVKYSKEDKINICLLGKWSPWKPSSRCTKSCTRSMRRECVVSDCQGESEKTESCTGGLCNTEKWSDWTPWSKCAKNCTRSRRRECLAWDCLQESKNRESCTGDLCVENVASNIVKGAAPVAAIVVSVVAAIIVVVSTVALWMKFRKKKTNEQTNPKPKPVTTDNITQYSPDYYEKYNESSKVIAKKEETTPSKDASSQTQPKSVKEDPKEDKKMKKTKNGNENIDGNKDYHEHSDEKMSKKTKKSESKKSNEQK